MRLLVFLFLLLALLFEATDAEVTTPADSALSWLSNNNTDNANNKDATNHANGDYYEENEDRLLIDRDTSSSNNKTDNSLVLAPTNNNNTDDQEQEDPFADDPFADDPFGGGSPADSEPDPWDAYPWDVTHTISHVSGALSVLGSGWIVVEILRDKKKIRLSYHRIILGLSTYDLASSFWLFIGVWVTDNQRGFAAEEGNFGIGLCETSGFFIFLGSLCIPMYNTALAIYFWVTIKYGWRESRIKQSYERYIHFIIFGCGIIPAVVAIPLEMYNPWYSYCFVTNAVIGGEERGTQEMRVAFLYLVLVFVFGSATVVSLTMISIYVNVSAIQKRVQRYNFGGHNNHINNETNGNNDNIEGSNKNNHNEQADLSDTTVPTHNEPDAVGNANVNSGRPTLQRKNSSRSSLGSILLGAAKNSKEFLRQKLSRTNRRGRSQMHNNNRKARTRQVRTMGLLYTIPFCATWVIPSIFFLMAHLAWTTGKSAWVNPRVTFVINTYIATILPIQGFFNWIIYMLPRFQRLRREHPSWGVKKLMMGVLGRIFTPRTDGFQGSSGADISKRCGARSENDDDIENNHGAVTNKNDGNENTMKNFSCSSSSSEEDDDFLDDESMMASLRYVKGSQEDFVRVGTQYGNFQITNKSQMSLSSEESCFEDCSMRFSQNGDEQMNSSLDESKHEVCSSTASSCTQDIAESDNEKTNCDDDDDDGLPLHHINSVDVADAEGDEVGDSLNILAGDVEQDDYENDAFGYSMRSDITIHA